MRRSSLILIGLSVLVAVGFFAAWRMVSLDEVVLVSAPESVERSTRWTPNMDCGSKEALVVLVVDGAELAEANSDGDVASAVVVLVHGTPVRIHVLVRSGGVQPAVAAFSGIGTALNGLIFSPPRSRVDEVEFHTSRPVQLSRGKLFCSPRF